MFNYLFHHQNPLFLASEEGSVYGTANSVRGIYVS